MVSLRTMVLSVIIMMQRHNWRLAAGEPPGFGALENWSSHVRLVFLVRYVEVVGIWNLVPCSSRLATARTRGRTRAEEARPKKRLPSPTRGPHGAPRPLSASGACAASACSSAPPSPLLSLSLWLLHS
jgi:hypothetical protein